MTPRQYVTAASVLSLRHRLTDQDWDVLRDVQTMRVARATDLQALSSVRGPLQVRQFRRRLQVLHELDVLARLERRIGGQRSGSSGWVYALGLAGQRLLDPGDGTSVRRPWTPRAAWLKHALAVSHLYVVLREAEHASQLALVTFNAEPTCWRPFADEEGPVTLKPDAHVRIETSLETASAFVEVDCATESPNTLARKCDVYRRYWLAEVEQDRHGLFPEVLWLVPSVGRLQTLRRVIARQPSDAQALHRVALYDDALTTLLEPP